MRPGRTMAWEGRCTDSVVRAASRLTDVRWANAVRGEYTRRVQKPHGCITSHSLGHDPYSASDCGNHPGQVKPGRCLLTSEVKPVPGARLSDVHDTCLCSTARRTLAGSLGRGIVIRYLYPSHSLSLYLCTWDRPKSATGRSSLTSTVNRSVTL